MRLRSKIGAGRVRPSRVEWSNPSIAINRAVLLAGTTVDIEPPESNGTGTVSVDDRGDTATISIDGETSDGAAIDATVECHSVFDFGG